MDFNSNIPINVRVGKRKRKLNRKRFSGFLLVLLIIAASIVAVSIYDDKIFESIKAGIFEDQTEKNTNKKDGTANQKTTGSNPGAADTSTAKEDTGNNAGSVNREESTPEKVEKVKDIEPLKKDLEEYTAKFQGKYGIYYMNLEDNTSFGINDTDTYIAASTVKIPINLYLFKKIKEGSITPDTKVKYIKSRDYEGGTGSLQGARDGSVYTVRRLSELSIKVSDNIATNMLIRLLGRQNYKNFMKELGGTVVTEKNVSCPKDMGIYMKAVYDFCNDNGELGKELIDNLKNTIFNDRITKLLPTEVEVAHKIGNQVRAVHDVGIVFAEKPYVLSVMSTEVNEKEAYDVIANISKKIYDYVTAE